MPADVAQVDVIVKLLQRDTDAHGDRDFFDRRIFVFEGLHGLVVQRGMGLKACLKNGRPGRCLGHWGVIASKAKQSQPLRGIASSLRSSQ